jgi:hypothetical protein
MTVFYIAALLISIHTDAETLKKFEIITDKEKTCVYAPEAKTEAEKKIILIEAAKSFLKTSITSAKTRQLCLAFIKPTSDDPNHSASIVNAYSYPGSGFEIVDPGNVSWTSVGQEVKFQVTLNRGFERADAFAFVSSMVNHINTECSVNDDVEGCVPNMENVRKLIHRDLKIKSHPLDGIF